MREQASRCGCSQPTALPTNDDGLGGIESLFFITYQGASSKAMSRSCRIRFLPLTPTTEQSSFALCRQGSRNKEGKGAIALQILTEPYVDLGRRLCPTEKLLALHPPWIFRPSNGPAYNKRN